MAFRDFFKRVTGNIVYYASPLTQKYQEKEYKDNLEVLKKLGVSVVTVKDEEQLGLELYNAGHRKEAKEQAKKVVDLLKHRRIYKIITSCPESYHTLKSKYAEWFDDFKVEVEHTSQTILEALKKKNIESIQKTEDVSYHDPCHLSHHEKECESAREVIELLGGNIVEATKHKEDSMCCGGGGCVLQNFPQEAHNMAKQRLTQFPDDVKKVVVPEGLCLHMLQQHDERVTPLGTYVLQKLRGLGL